LQYRSATSLFTLSQPSQYKQPAGTTGNQTGMETVMKTLLALSALAGALCLTSAATAAPDHAPIVRAVGHQDLNLTTAKGRNSLDRRIEIAIATACGDASSADPLGWKAIKRCRTEAAARVATQRDQVIATAQAAGGTRLAAQ
jgi:UrcA family protein